MSTAENQFPLDQQYQNQNAALASVEAMSRTGLTPSRAVEGAYDAFNSPVIVSRHRVIRRTEEPVPYEVHLDDGVDPLAFISEAERIAHDYYSAKAVRIDLPSATSPESTTDRTLGTLQRYGKNFQNLFVVMLDHASEQQDNQQRDRILRGISKIVVPSLVVVSAKSPML